MKIAEKLKEWTDGNPEKLLLWAEAIKGLLGIGVGGSMMNLSASQAGSSDLKQVAEQFRERKGNREADQGNYNHCLQALEILDTKAAEKLSIWAGTLSRWQRETLQKRVSNMFFDHLITSQDRDVQGAAIIVAERLRQIADYGDNHKERTEKAIRDGLLKSPLIQENEESKQAREQFEQAASEALDGLNSKLKSWKDKLKGKENKNENILESGG